MGEGKREKNENIQISPKNKVTGKSKEKRVYFFGMVYICKE